LTLTPRVTNKSPRKPDRVAGALAAGFVVLLLATEAMLTLPDETATPAAVASFYATHRAFIVILQLLGMVAAALLGLYAWRLRSVDRVVAAAGMIMAGCGLIPGLITLVIAVVADPNDASSAARWNQLETARRRHPVRRHRDIRGRRRDPVWWEPARTRRTGRLCGDLLPDSAGTRDLGKASGAAGRHRPTVIRCSDRGDGDLELSRHPGSKFSSRHSTK
jgi:hypothetical protein